jgi:hypothetical protein
MSAIVLGSWCAVEVVQEPWASWSTDKQALHQYTGMSVAEVEMVYALCSDELLTLAAQMRQPNVDTPTLSSHNLLAITLYWLRRHPSYQQMVVEHQRSTSFWHRSVRRVIDVLDRNIVGHFIPPLSANAPSSTFFDRVKIIVDTTFVPLPKSPFLPKDYHKKSPTKAAWK